MELKQIYNSLSSEKQKEFKREMTYKQKWSDQTFSNKLSGKTEMRPGEYLIMDLVCDKLNIDHHEP